MENKYLRRTRTVRLQNKNTPCRFALSEMHDEVVRGADVDLLASTLYIGPESALGSATPPETRQLQSPSL